MWLHTDEGTETKVPFLVQLRGKGIGQTRRQWRSQCGPAQTQIPSSLR